MAQRSRLRASDEDRERIADRLRHAAAEGRLLSEELEQRLATALRARTYGELDSVVADLPVDKPSRRGSSRPPARRRLTAPSPLMLAGLVVAIPLIFALMVAVVVVLMTLTVMWAVFALVTWRLLGHRRVPPGPWWLYTRARRRRGPLDRGARHLRRLYY
jgi:Flp pilus assembly protein TadB